MTGYWADGGWYGSPEAGTGSPVGYVVAGKGWKTESVSHLSHGLPPLPSAAPGSGQPPVHQGERQRSPELSSARPIGSSPASARRLLALVVTAGPHWVSLPLEELPPPRFVYLGMTKK